MPNAGATSAYIVMVDDESCAGCTDCVERCHMEALVMEGDVVIRDAKGCIGCGLCVSVCPTGALSMVPRLELPHVPWDRQELNAALKSSMKIG
jgi:ferredoxin